MALTSHLSIKINNSNVQGESTQQNKNGVIELTEVRFKADAPTDLQTGLSTGRRQYFPIYITKRVDKSSPIFHQALTMNQNCEGTITFYRPPADAKSVSEAYYTVEFKSARITSIDFHTSVFNTPGITGPGAKDPNDYAMETIGIAFGQITVTFIKGGIVSTDSWMSQG